MRRLLFLLPVLVFLAAAAVLAFGLSRDPSVLPSALIDRPLPSFALDDPRAPGDPSHALSTDDFGGRPMLLNVFGSWCVGCRIEHPFLMRLAAEGVTIHGLDWKDEPGAGARWLIEQGDPYAHVGDDADGRTAIDLGVTGAPETFVIDRKGRIRHRHVGPITEDVWRDQLQPLMARLEAEP